MRLAGISQFKGFGAAAVMVLAATGCTTTTLVQEKAPLPVVPEYVKIPHPAGFDLADLRAIFLNPLAPKDVLTSFGDTCDAEFRKLIAASPSAEDRNAGAKELVTSDPERMHWCFYTKISKLQEVLQGDTTWAERQKSVLDGFGFLSPIANAFLNTYHDSRYLRWATQYYSKVSEWVFFKKLAPTAENTLLLTTGARELEPWIPVQRAETTPASVFTRYGITLMPTVAGGMNPYESKRAPASAPPTEAAPAQATEIISSEPQFIQIPSTSPGSTSPGLRIVPAQPSKP